MAKNAVSASELTFDLTKMAAADFPRLSTHTARAAISVLPKIVVQCPWGDPADIATWAGKVPTRALAGVMQQLHLEAKRVRVEPTGWTFNFAALVVDDLDTLDAAFLRGQVRDGARMIAKYAIGMPTGLLERTRPAVLKRLGEDGQEAAPEGDSLAARDVLELTYYPEFIPLLQKAREEAHEEFRAGFLGAIVSTPVSSDG
ncbi:MAG: hypothetical protein IPM16_06755 [Chloroflexi bacterium]|nr:hypothetical protein [Chloroflexota bacterium]